MTSPLSRVSVSTPPDMARDVAKLTKTWHIPKSAVMVRIWCEWREMMKGAGK